MFYLKCMAAIAAVALAAALLIWAISPTVISIGVGFGVLVPWILLGLLFALPIIAITSMSLLWRNPLTPSPLIINAQPWYSRPWYSWFGLPPSNRHTHQQAISTHPNHQHSHQPAINTHPSSRHSHQQALNTHARNQHHLPRGHSTPHASPSRYTNQNPIIHRHGSGGRPGHR